MSSFSLLKMLLFWEVPELLKTGESINELSLLLVPVLLIASAAYALHTHKVCYKTLLTRVFISYAVASFIGGYYTKTAFFGFSFGEEAIASKHSGIFKKWFDLKKDIEASQEKEKEKKKTLSVESIRKIINIDIEDAVEKFALLAIIMILQIVKVLYTGSFYLSYCIIPFLVVLSILPMFHKISDGLIRFIFWMILIPIVVSLIIVILGKLLDITIGKDGFIDSIMGIAFVLIACIGLLSSFSIAKKLISNGDLTGFSTSGAKVAQNMMAFAGVSVMKDLVSGKSGSAIKSSALMFANPVIGAGLNIAKGIGSSVGNFSKDMANTGKDLLHDKALDIKSNKYTQNQSPELQKSFNRENQTPYSSDLSSNLKSSYEESGSLLSTFGNLSNYSTPIKERVSNLPKRDKATYETTPSEKLILGANKLFNGARNNSFSDFKKNISKEVVNDGPGKELRNKDIVQLYRSANEQRDPKVRENMLKNPLSGGIPTKQDDEDNKRDRDSNSELWSFSLENSENNKEEV
jgi:hypothetical protein